jgi:hypothetical protein
VILQNVQNEEKMDTGEQLAMSGVSSFLALVFSMALITNHHAYLLVYLFTVSLLCENAAVTRADLHLMHHCICSPVEHLQYAMYSVITVCINIE